MSAQAFTRSGSADDEAVLAAEFARSRSIALPGFVAPELVRQLSGIWQAGEFRPEKIDRIGHRAVETPGRAGAMIRFVLGRKALFDWLGTITGADDLGGAIGGVVQMRQGEDEWLTWHSDLDDPRQVLGVTINLGEAPYDGGVFEMRRKGEAALCCRHQHTTPGEALIFEVSPGLEHRVTPLTAGGPRTIFAGWFVTA